MSVLEQVNSPQDLRKLTLGQLKKYCDEVRKYMIFIVQQTGGHLASSLGTVELTVALHYVFDTPTDKIIWDVGHQAYTHKIITGRRSLMKQLRKWGGISGFTRRTESEYDPFGAGHASTSISAGLGIKTALDLRGKKNKVISVIGDGALTGGLAYEGLNNLGELQKNMLVILNDNRMSISPNIGGIRKYLSSLISNPTYKKLKLKLEHVIKLFPKAIGKRLDTFSKRFLEATKSLLVNNQFFEAMGIHYIGPIDGNDLEVLIKILRNIKATDASTLLHIYTVKGKGYSPAEADSEKFHGLSPASKTVASPTAQTFSKVFGEIMLSLAKKRKDIVAITAAMKAGTGLSGFAEKYPSRFFDVGIAEAHALTFAAGLASQGIRPVAAIYSTFLQRAYDQIIHDIALQNLPVIIAVDRAGIVGDDGPTHHGMFDVAYLLPIPNLEIISPANKSDMIFAFNYALEKNNPVIIRYPRGICPDHKIPGDITKDGYFLYKSLDKKLLIIAVGQMLDILLPVSKKLNVSLFNPLFLKPVSDDIFSSYQKIVVVEDAVKTGGFFQAIKANSGYSDRISGISFPDEFIPFGSTEDIFSNYGMDAASLTRKIRALMK